MGRHGRVGARRLVGRDARPARDPAALRDDRGGRVVGVDRVQSRARARGAARGAAGGGTQRRARGDGLGRRAARLRGRLALVRAGAVGRRVDRGPLRAGNRGRRGRRGRDRAARPQPRDPSRGGAGVGRRGADRAGRRPRGGWPADAAGELAGDLRRAGAGRPGRGRRRATAAGRARARARAAAAVGARARAGAPLGGVDGRAVPVGDPLDRRLGALTAGDGVDRHGDPGLHRARHPADARRRAHHGRHRRRGARARRRARRPGPVAGRGAVLDPRSAGADRRRDRAHPAGADRARARRARTRPGTAPPGRSPRATSASCSGWSS